MSAQGALLFHFIRPYGGKVFGINPHAGRLILRVMKWICLFAILACVPASSAPIAFESSERQTALLELYTSEGCSSCPPAEAWLSKLKSAAGLWTNLVPVAFHVDYWNNLGWRDELSSEEFSDRQRHYAQAWSAE